MNKLIRLFHDYTELHGVKIHVGTWAILETPCYPCSYYFGPANFVKSPRETKGEWYTGDNATSNWHRTEKECHELAAKKFPESYHPQDTGG